MHDAWNRLVKVQNQPLPSGSPTTLSEYEYNGLHWRTVKRHDTTTPANGLDQQTQMYYDASWRLVEERVDENYISSAGVNRHMQNLWGARYIDDLVSRRKDANRDGDYIDSTDGIFYAVSDVQFSVVAMLTSTGKLHERVAYDSYGTARHHWKDDVDGDGDVDSSDKSAVTALLNKAIYQSGYNPAADIDRSGTIDSTDVGLVSTKVIAALPAGEISDRAATGPDNTIGYDGYIFNPENLLYTVRFRHYDTGLGRWLQRDPAGYVDGMSLYEFTAGEPLSFGDPMGLFKIIWKGKWTAAQKKAILDSQSRIRLRLLELQKQLTLLERGLSPCERSELRHELDELRKRLRDMLVNINSATKKYELYQYDSKKNEAESDPAPIPYWSIPLITFEVVIIDPPYTKFSTNPAVDWRLLTPAQLDTLFFHEMVHVAEPGGDKDGTGHFYDPHIMDDLMRVDIRKQPAIAYAIVAAEKKCKVKCANKTKASP